MGLFAKGFNSKKEVQKVADAANTAVAGAQGAIAAVAGKAGEIADGVKQGVANARAKEPDEYDLAIID